MMIHPVGALYFIFFVLRECVLDGIMLVEFRSLEETSIYKAEMEKVDSEVWRSLYFYLYDCCSL